MIAGARRFVRPPLVAGILLLALIAFASRACDQSRVSVTQAEAVATARTQIDYPPDGHNVRFLRRGLTQHPYWAVSLWTRAPGRRRLRARHRGRGRRPQRGGLRGDPEPSGA